MKQIILPVIIVLILIGLVLIFRQPVAKRTGEVNIDGHTFKVELAQTESEREKGLMNRASLDENAGMLFVFPSAAIYPFWMKDTLIPLDILWIENDTIVDMTTLTATTGVNIAQYRPKNKANYVLEINAGLIKKYNFKVGETVSLNY